MTKHVARRIIVTGGAGFIGSALCRHLVAGGDHVLNIDKLTYAATLTSLRALEHNPAYHFLKADIADEAAVQQAFDHFQPDGVIHLAAESHVDRSITGPRAFVDTNVTGTFTLLEAARAYWAGLAAEGRARFRFLHVSTDEVYGALGPSGQFTEQTAYAPSSPYSASKAAADHLVMAWHTTYGLPSLISNCSNNFGPYHFPEKLVPLTILNALHGQPIPVYGQGTQIRDWLYVEDHVHALRCLLDDGKPGERYNVGARNEHRNIDLVHRICALLDSLRPGPSPHGALIRFVQDRPGHDARYAVDPGKIERDIGWNPAHRFEDALEKTVRWYLDNEWWWRPLRARYAGERLGLDAAAMDAGPA